MCQINASRIGTVSQSFRLFAKIAGICEIFRENDAKCAQFDLTQVNDRYPEPVAISPRFLVSLLLPLTVACSEAESDPTPGAQGGDSSASGGGPTESPNPGEELPPLVGPPGETPTPEPTPGDCTPQAEGKLVVQSSSTGADGKPDGVVFDERTCLHWAQKSSDSMSYSDAVSYCDQLELGGFDDWRLPSAAESASIFSSTCGWPHLDRELFNVNTSMFWSSTDEGTFAGDLPKKCCVGQDGGSFIACGQVGGQGARCVRGASSLPDIAACTTAAELCNHALR